MFLKRLDLQGFKTFATRSEFVFDSGITAIVGPNGSGKSNIADAVRWVLGEQAARPLRIKRSDDVIFAGSSTRPRVGMAEVSITLDNTTKWLPLDFSEVTITRRAYRSGESEYLINKSRVRLRDVVGLLLAANIGQNNYTVIGQGAIDAALSLRPEERRELFEEAADIKRYQIKRNDALVKLQTTNANLVRVRDLMAEIAPRLKVLQEQAQRAQEQEQLIQELRGYLAAWYAHRWNDASDGLRKAMLSETDAQQALDQAENALQEILVRLTELRQRESALRMQLAEWHRQSSDVHTQAEALERQMAGGRATLDSLSRQQQEITDEVMRLQEHLAARQQDVVEAETALQTLAAQQRQRQSTLAQLEQEASVFEEQRQATQRRLEAAEDTLLSMTSAVAATQSKLTALAARRQMTLETIKQRQSQRQQHEASARTIEEEISALRSHLGTQDRAIAIHTSQRPALQSAIAAARRDFEAAQLALATVHDERRSLELRLETLSRLHESMAGYDIGVRSVLNASRSGILAGVIGTVASLLRVPSQYEAAIGVALGNHEQDIVVQTWQVAESAVEHLRQTQAGRATFLPLDVIKGQRASAKVSEAIGWAANLVESDERFHPITSYLLGRVLIVKDLSTARRLLSQTDVRSISSIVTLAGDIVRPGGAITGGSPRVRSSGLLERERELADLPKTIAAARASEQALDQKLASAQTALRQAEEQLVSFEGRLAALHKERDEQAAQAALRQREWERWQHEIAWLQAQEDELNKDLASLNAEEALLFADLATQNQRQKEAQHDIVALRQQLAMITGGDLVVRLAEARTAAALGDQDLQARRTLLNNQQQEAERIAEQIAAKQQRLNELATEMTALTSSLDGTHAELANLLATASALQERMNPADVELVALEKERSTLLEVESQARARLSALERAHSQAAIEVQRARNELGKLQAQIEAEESLEVKGYGLAEEDVARLLQQLAVPVQLSLSVPDARDMPDMQTPAISPEVLKRRIDQLRNRLRHLGPVNPNAISDYGETLKRYTFLTSQSEDLEQAVKSLKTVIAELDEMMRTRFETTFEAVSREFRRYFTTLFGGGTARLTLTDPDDPAQTGVDIVAQPPGKRLQSLALLSGGERALTATALLFAILTVNPIPFCILDEVDAALDDANVGRFCDALRLLAQRTQFIVITHNKGTMETATSLYGISMTADGTSQVLSLKLEDVSAGV